MQTHELLFVSCSSLAYTLETSPSTRPHVVDPLSQSGIHAHDLVHESNSWDLNRFAYSRPRDLIQPPHPYLSSLTFSSFLTGDH